MGTDFPIVSIVIVNLNGKSFLHDSLLSLQNLDYPRKKLEVIVVDNGSNDGSVEYVNATFPSTFVLKLEKNYGFCKPNNEASKIAKGKYLVFLNNDTIVSRDWLKELVKGTFIDPDIMCCASKILYYDMKKIVNAAGGKITKIGGGFYKGYGAVDCRSTCDSYEYTGFGCGAGVLVSKEFFLSIGGFDEDYFASCEEHELGLRVWMNGFKVLFVPTAVMYHKESGTFGAKGSSHPVKVYLLVRNRLYNIFKNFELSNVIKGLIMAVMFDAYRSMNFVLEGNFASIRSTAKAYFCFAKNLKRTVGKRRSVQEKRVRTDEELCRLNVIASLKESLAEEKRLSKVLKSSFYSV
jgi:GT2 family glycosyltransferase